MTAETQVQTQTLPVGQVLEDYRITSVLGQGGFGITYKAADETLRRDVAIKEYLPRQFAFRDATGRVHARSQADEELFEWGLNRFVDEGRALAMFRHPNIASVIRYIQHNGTAYLVMEFEEGKDLEHWLAGRDRPDEQRLVRGILVPVLEGLARVHDKGLLHRDIKPDNIFIRRDGTPVLIDFGASRPHGPEATSRLTSIISAGYSPFEQYGMGDKQGPWSDLYALAGTVYRVISGAPPVDAIARHQGAPLEPASSVGAGRYSKRLLEAIDRALSLDIAARPQSAREFLSLLGLEPPPPPADPDATVVNLQAPPASRPRSHRGLVLGASVVIAVAAAAYYLLAPFPGGAGVPPESDEMPAVTSGRSAGSDTEEQPEPSTSNAQVAQTTGAGGSPSADEDSAAGAGGSTAGNAGKTTRTVNGTAAGTDAGGDAASASDSSGAPDLSEDRIIAGLELATDVRSYREDQLIFTIARYTEIRNRFDQCRDKGCGDLTKLFAEAQKWLEPQTWLHGDARGSLQILNPRRLDNDDCPFMLDVQESISVGDEHREQMRTYCTNGHDRVVEQAREVT